MLEQHESGEPASDVIVVLVAPHDVTQATVLHAHLKNPVFLFLSLSATHVVNRQGRRCKGFKWVFDWLAAYAGEVCVLVPGQDLQCRRKNAIYIHCEEKESYVSFLVDETKCFAVSPMLLLSKMLSIDNLDFLKICQPWQEKNCNRGRPK